jgi:tetrahydromethanopterin S-methyltransferase subunit A
MLGKAAASKKCWACGCLHDSLAPIEQAFDNSDIPEELRDGLYEVRTRLTQLQYDCLGCEVCYPAVALNALSNEGRQRLVTLEPCHAEKVEERDGWPPLPGSYAVLRYRAPVAICTLTDDALQDRFIQEAGQEIAIVGTLQTENLGIERLIANVLANPNIRFLIVCGADSKQAIGHLPGQSIMALVRFGLEEQGLIIGANGKRPIILNLPGDAVEHFRKTVEMVDFVGSTDIQLILEASSTCAERYPGPAEPFPCNFPVTPIKGYIPKSMHPDPLGYFVIYVDHQRGLLCVEHYRNDGVLDTLVEGRKAAELYFPVIDRGLISKLDHAAYLGRELAQAERALESSESYRQDAAPESIAECSEAKACSCSSV